MILTRLRVTLTKNAKAVTIAPGSVTIPLAANVLATRNPMSQTGTNLRLTYRH